MRSRSATAARQIKPVWIALAGSERYASIARRHKREGDRKFRATIAPRPLRAACLHQHGGVQGVYSGRTDLTARRDSSGPCCGWKASLSTWWSGWGDSGRPTRGYPVEGREAPLPLASMRLGCFDVRRGIYIMAVVGATAFGLWRFWPNSASDGATTRKASDPRLTARVRNAVSGSTEVLSASENSAEAAGSSARRQAARLPTKAWDAQALLEQARSVLKSDPDGAELLAREYREKFPNGTEMDDNDAILVISVLNQRDVDRARYEAVQYFRRHPDGDHTERISRLTGMRPPRHR